MKKVIYLSCCFLFFACQNETKITEEKPEDTSSELNEETLEVIQEKDNKEDANSFALPKGILTPTAEEIEIEETIFKMDLANNHVLNKEEVAMYLTEGLDVVLSYYSEAAGVTKNYKLDIGDFNDSYLEVKPTLNDFDPELKNGNELVLNWKTSDGRNGMEDGYEMERRGVVVVHLPTGNSFLNMVYFDEYATYSVSEDFDADRDEHGKMAEDTEWERCALNTEFSYLRGMINISKSTVDSVGKCNLIPHQVGSYTFNATTQQFELVDEK